MTHLTTRWVLVHQMINGKYSVDIFIHYPEVNKLLQNLLIETQTVLNEQFVGMYLFGSLTSGDFDQDNDNDVLIISAGEISDDIFSALQVRHKRIYAGDSPWIGGAFRCSDTDLHPLKGIEWGLCHKDEGSTLWNYILRFDVDPR